MIPVLRLDVATWVRLHPRLTAAAMSSLQMVFLGVALSRGLDYLLPPVPSTQAITYVEGIIPIEIWGAAMTAASVVAFIGLRWTAACPIALTACAHASLTGIYAGFGLSATINALDTWPPQDWRIGLAGVGAACVHGILGNASWVAWQLQREERGLPE